MPILQLLTKAHILNVPEFFDAGKVSIQNSFAPFSKSPYVLLASMVWDGLVSSVEESNCLV